MVGKFLLLCMIYIHELELEFIMTPRLRDGKPKSHCFSQTILTITMLMILGSTRQVRAEDCPALIGIGVLIGCQDSLIKDEPQVDPSHTCCKAIKDIGLLCTCKIVTKDIEKIISLDKFVYVAKFCGTPLTPGSLCGSYKVPPAIA